MDRDQSGPGSRKIFDSVGVRGGRRQVSPITLTLWGNDLAPLSAKGRRAPRAIASFASRFNSILRQLRSAAPTAEIIVTGAWNPEADQLRPTRPLYRSLKWARECPCPEGSALRTHALVQGRSASDRRRVPSDGRRLHDCVGLPADAVEHRPRSESAHHRPRRQEVLTS